MKSTSILPLFMSLLLLACVQDDDFAIPEIVCYDPALSPTKTIDEIFEESSVEPHIYTDADVITAYVISNDQTGNFYKTLYLQNPEGTRGLSIPINQEHLYTIYAPGRKVYIKLQNTHNQIKDDGLIIGNLVDQQVNRLSSSNFKNIVVPACERIETDPFFKSLSLSEINQSHINTLVNLVDVQFEQVAVGRTLYDTTNDAGGGTNYNITDISGTQIRVRTSSFADFGGAAVPAGNGSIRGVLTKFGIHYQLLPRSLEDFNMPNERKRIGFAEEVSGSLTNLATVRAFFKGKDVIYPHDHYIEGVITMSGIDQKNLSDRSVFIQDESGGMALRFSHITSLIRGQKVRVQLKDAVLNSNKGLLQINRVQWQDVAFIDENVSVSNPPLVSISDLKTGKYQGELVQLENIQFEEATGKFQGSKTLMDCKDVIQLLTLNTASFSDQEYPTKNGPIRAIVSADNTPILVIRDLEDMAEMQGERCIPRGDLSQEVFFSEFADPDNNADARFLELFNAGDSSIDLTGWRIDRYTNDNTSSTASIDLSSSTIDAKSTFVIAVNSEVFETVYGFPPDLVGTTNGPAGSNGDDTMVLIDPDGTLIDIFGRIGEDGSGTDHEFEDGRAIRLDHIVKANAVYTFLEWQIFNDTGAAGTTKQPQQAPADFSPGKR